MRIAFRTDANTQIGSGHVMRCLTLADALREHGCDVHFLCSVNAAALGDLIRERGHSLHLIAAPSAHAIESGAPPHSHWLASSQADDAMASSAILAKLNVGGLVVDHYALDYRWETVARRYVSRILVVDDLADRVHDCDLVLDQNFYCNAHRRYDALVPDACERLLGPAHALLRPEFNEARTLASPRSTDVKRILVFFGGFDPQNYTGVALQALRMLSSSPAACDVVIGRAHPARDSIARQCAGLFDCRLHMQVSNMAELMASADLAVGAGGSATLERCFLGLPTLAVDVADNQRAMLRDLDECGHIRHLGSADSVTAVSLANSLDRFISDATLRVDMSTRNMSLVANGTQAMALRLTKALHA